MRTSRPIDLFRRLGGSTAATAAVEMSFIAPILVFLAAGMVDFGFGVYTKMMVGDTAQAGAAYAQLNAVNYTQASCTSNSPPCTWDQSVTTAATKAHPSGTAFSTAPTASALVLSCCIQNGVVSFATCTQPPTAAPACAAGSPGTYVQVTASSELTTIIPYSFVSKLFNLNFTITNPQPIQTTYLVRIQ